MVDLLSVSVLLGGIMIGVFLTVVIQDLRKERKTW
jgi:hypothetical protein